jgi:hypothetical protein
MALLSTQRVTSAGITPALTAAAVGGDTFTPAPAAEHGQGREHRGVAKPREREEPARVADSDDEPEQAEETDAEPDLTVSGIFIHSGA